MIPFKRNALGLVEGVQYRYLDNGMVDWRAMIPPQYLVVQKDHEKEVVARYGKDLRDLDPREVDDRYLMILLGGIKHLLRLRGFRSVQQRMDYVSEYKAVATCTIEFLPNFETEGASQTFSDSSSASIDSVSGTFRLYLESIAANRAFVRAVRNGLGINILAKDEFDERAARAYDKKQSQEPDTSELSGFAPYKILADKCKAMGVSFDKLRDRALEIRVDTKIESDPATWGSFGDIPNNDSYTLLNRLIQAEGKKTVKSVTK